MHIAGENDWKNDWKNDWEIVAEEVMYDRVNIFLRVRSTDSPAEVVRAFKGRSSLVLREEFPWLGRLCVLWSKSYFAASLGYVLKETVRRYIEHQWDVPA